MRRFWCCVSILAAIASECAGTYDIEDSPVGVAGELILGGVSDKALLVGEGDP